MLASFVSDYLRYVLKGGTKFYAWMGILGLFILGMLYVFYLQNTEGLIVTGMTSQIHDGLYFANLVFLVGVAAGAVTIVFPAYVYHHEGMHKVTVLGEMLAVTAVIMVMLFVFAHMGRPDRLWHMVPVIGIYSLSSMLGWDVLVLEKGNDLEAVIAMLRKAKRRSGKGKPVVILMKSEMGHGVDYMQGNHKWHGKAPNAEQFEQAMKQLPETGLGDF